MLQAADLSYISQNHVKSEIQQSATEILLLLFEHGGRERTGLNVSGLLALEYKVQQQKLERSCFNMVEGKKQCESCPLLPTPVQWYACIDPTLTDTQR